MGLKEFGLASLLFGSVMACTPKADEVILKDVPLKTQYSHHVFESSGPKADSGFFRRKLQSEFPVYSIGVGMDLDGTTMGVGIENKSSLQYYSVSQKSHILRGVSLPFGVGFERSTLTGYLYNDKTLKQITFSGRMYTKDEFEFLGADWRYGFGGGLSLALHNKQVMLIDSSYANELTGVSFYPAMLSFGEVFFDNAKAAGIRFMFDMNVVYPPTIQMSVVFSADLEKIMRYAEENSGK